MRPSRIMSTYISRNAFAHFVAGILFLFLTAPAYAVDTDGDGLDDAVETNTGVYVSPIDTGTDPNNADTDYDSIPDGLELQEDRSVTAASNDNRPNILLIVGEDHGCELSCYGDLVIKTPNIDRLASQGVLFENGYVTQSVCSPSRSTIFTGLYPQAAEVN